MMRLFAVFSQQGMYFSIKRCAIPLATKESFHVRHVSLWARARNFFKVVMTDYDQTEKGIREHKDLAMALLAHTHRRLRREYPEKDVDALLDDAIAELEERGMEDIGVRATRYELQQELVPEVLRIFETFQKVDGTVGGITSYKDDCGARTVLMKDYQDTLVAMNTLSEQSKEHARCNEFYRRKVGALRTLLSWAKVEGIEELDVEDTLSTMDNSDDFGYIAEGVEEDVVKAIRNYQTQNMLRSALIRNEIGHSVLALKSTVTGAGRGVFLDGKAMEGSLVAFIPGQVLPKEYLINPSPALESYLSQDYTHQLSLRSDDILIDSRKSPYTVLDEEGSNPWAIGHIINHPPPNVIPNCRTVMINFTEPMNLRSTGLMRYVPNAYKRNPMLVGPRLLERDNIVMHGMAIMTRRDVANEELFYDYKFTGNDNPKWYHDATYEHWADERD